MKTLDQNLDDDKYIDLVHLATIDEVKEMIWRDEYMYTIKNDSQCLYFIGSSHQYNPSHSQFSRIGNLWNEFLNSIDSNNTIALIEGGLRPLEPTSEIAIKKHGEAGYLVFLCSHHNVPVESPEPTTEDEINTLLLSYSKDEIMYYYFSRIVHHWHRREGNIPLKNFVEQYMNEYHRITRWTDLDFSFDHFVSLHNQLNNHLFSLKDMQCMHDNSNPTFNPVASSLSHYRDELIIKAILNHWYTKKSIIVVYGSGHAIVQERALKTLLV